MSTRTQRPGFRRGRFSLRPPRGLVAGAAIAAVVAAAFAFGWPGWRLRFASDEQLAVWAEGDPADARVQFALGERLRQRGDDAAAAVALGRAATLQPANLSARRELARALLDLGREDEAMLHLREVARRDPGDAFAQEQLGGFYLARGAISWAADAFQRVVAARPGEAAGWAHLGDCYLELHQAERALGAFEKACRLDPRRPGYRVGLGRAYLEAGRPDRAEAELRRALAGPAGAEAAYWLGILCMAPERERQPREDEAVRWLSEACRRAPGDPRPWLALGRLMLRQRQPGRAASLLERAAALAPERPEPLYLLARAYGDRGQRERARALLQQFAARSQFEQQRQHLELRLTQSPHDPALLQRLSQLYARHGDPAEAQEISRRRTEDRRMAPEVPGATTDGRRP